MTTEQDILQIAQDINRIAEEISACHFGWGNELRDLANHIRSTGPQAVDRGEAEACPFCGSHDTSDGEILSSNADGSDRATQSECRTCGAVGPKALLRPDEVDYGAKKSIAAWNQRAHPIPKEQS